MKLILASASPRRSEILSAAGIPFEALPAEIDETPLLGEGVEAMTRRLAAAKAKAVAATRSQGREPVLILGADTAVEADGEIFGKPSTAAEARAMLERLSGRRHRVVTAITMIRLQDGVTRFDLASTDVWFAALTPDEIASYVASGEPFGKAGGYGIQGRAGRYIERIEGCYFNVVGLPLSRAYRLLTELGWESDP